jgi:anti-anti-sigma regulatory factor
MNSFQSTIGIVAGALSIVAVIPYIVTTLRGQTQPHRITWWILSVLGLMMSASHFAAGGGSTVWVPLCGAIGQLAVAILSLRYGTGGWSHLDRLCLAGVGLSLVLWRQFDSPLLALGLNIAIDFLGCLPTIRKAQRDPAGEDVHTWCIYALSGGLNLLAVQRWTLAETVLPLYLALCPGLITLLLIRRYWRWLEAKYRFVQGVRLYQYDRVLLFQLQGPMVLGRAQNINRGRFAMQTANSVVFDLTQVPVMGGRSAKAIAATMRYAHRQGLQVYLVGANPGIRRQLGRLGVFDVVRSQHVLNTCAAALQKAVGRIAQGAPAFSQQRLQLF